MELREIPERPRGFTTSAKIAAALTIVAIVLLTGAIINGSTLTLEIGENFFEIKPPNPNPHFDGVGP